MAKYRDSVKISYQTSYLQIRTQQPPGFYRFQESIDTPQAEPEPGKDAVPSDYMVWYLRKRGLYHIGGISCWQGSRGIMIDGNHRDISMQLQRPARITFVWSEHQPKSRMGKTLVPGKPQSSLPVVSASDSYDGR